MMTDSVVAQHRAEVKSGERFEFGKNWSRFLSTLNDEKIAIAEKSLQKSLGASRLDGKTFLDVGSGSGLFSLAARRLGAKVHSFDYDTNSVGCTNELRRRYFPDDKNWLVQQGSVLDRQFLGTLGTFDIVYSWGVLHHTGQMWQALDNVKPLVRMDGQLFIAIYNDLGAVTDRWLHIKQIYNRLPAFLRLPYALVIIAQSDGRAIVSHWRHGSLREYIKSWTEYDRTGRGMNKWYDWIDWIGGYPYECATLEELVDFYGKDGFSLQWMESRAHGTGCNEVVFQRKAPLGVFVDNPMPKSRFLLRAAGRRLVGPYRLTNEGYVAKLPDVYSGQSASSFVLFRDGTLVGPAVAANEPDTILIGAAEDAGQQIQASRFDVVRGKVQPIGPEFRHYSENMFGVALVDLKDIADNTTPSHDSSPVFVFENKQQLSQPHAIHDDIAKHGSGRYSHWGQELVFSSSDNSDPRSNGRLYEIVIAEP